MHFPSFLKKSQILWTKRSFGELKIDLMKHGGNMLNFILDLTRFPKKKKKTEEMHM